MIHKLNLVIALLLCAIAPLQAQAKKYNVLHILADDLSARLGCYEDPQVKSPNLDRLAKQGVTFMRAYCQYPLCNPSRASFMTGRRPDVTQTITNAPSFREFIPDTQTIGQQFQAAGYFSARVGKIYHYGVPTQIGTPGLDDPPTWNLAINPAGQDIIDEWEIINYMPNAKKKTGAPGERPGLGAALSWRADPVEDDAETDGKVTLETIQLLEQYKDKPFYIAAGFYRPHVPEVGPAKYWDQYKLDDMRLPTEPPEHLANIPAIAFYVKPAHYGIPQENLRKFLHAYFACTTFMDAQVGRLLDALDRLKLRDSTIVLFHSDHGWNLGEHGQWQKMSLFEPSARVPLIVCLPGAKGNGSKSGRTVELVDVAATLADLCQLKAPDYLDGKSLRPLLENPQAKWDKPAYTQVARGIPVGTDAPKTKKNDGKQIMGRSVRTERYRYTEWGDNASQGAELYDYDRDPHELNNLAADPGSAAVLKQMKSLLDHMPRRK